MRATTLSSLLLVADGRLPVGAHANSAGVEWAAKRDDFRDVAVLERWVRGRLGTTGLVDAAFACAASSGQLDALDVELEARIPGSRARTVSRQLGRQFIRAATRIWPEVSVSSNHPDGFFAPIALGAVAGTLGLTPRDIASVSFHHTVAASATGAIRLLGLDPLDVTAMQARLGETVAELTIEADSWACCSHSHLPATTSPLADILAEDHGQWSQRLFVA